MIWVAYEKLIGNKWELYLEPCTTSQYESLKKRVNVIIISVERIKIV